MLKLLAIGFVALLAIPATLIGLPMATEDTAIPDSCVQPDEVDYSGLGRTAYPPYQVKLTSMRRVPWSRTSGAVVGHGLTEDGEEDYGVHLDLETTDLDAVTCRWTREGVTIVEPPTQLVGADGQPGQTIGGIEHVVPALRFLGGR